MKESEKKCKRSLPAAELGNYLRQIADAIEGRAEREERTLQTALSDYSKIELKIKRKQETVEIKCKVKSEVPPPGMLANDSEKVSKDVDNDKLKYKKLKKRMKSSFKAISESLEQNEAPEVTTVKSFISDSELMIGYPGYGDEYYDAYRELLEQFAGACERSDLALIQQFHARLKALKDECHERFK